MGAISRREFQGRVRRVQEAMARQKLDAVKAYGHLSTALGDAKADLAKAEATVESLVTAAKKAV